MYGFLLVLFSNFIGFQGHSFLKSNFEIFDFKNPVTLKTGLGARRGHWKCHHSIERIRLPIDILYSNLWFYLVAFLRYSMSKNVMTLKSGAKVTQGL